MSVPPPTTVPSRSAVPSRPSPAAARAAGRVLAALLAAALLVALAPSARAEQGRWRWPLPPPHAVLAPFEAPAHRYGPGHRGIDIEAAAEGAQVRAVEAGTVRFSGMVAGRGVVSVVHADGLLSTYEPVRGVLEEGDPVAAGEVLGTLAAGSGTSHCPDARCLHLGARRGTTYQDPLALLGARGPSVLLPWHRGRAGSGGGVVPRGGAGSGDVASLPSAAVRSVQAGLAAAAPTEGLHR